MTSKHSRPWSRYQDSTPSAITGDDIEALAPVVAVPGFHALRHRAHALSGVVHSLHRGAHAGRIPQLKRPHFPVEAGPHGAVHAGRIVGDLRQTIRRIVP